MKRMRRNREGTGKVHKVGFESREKNTRIYDKRGEQGR